MQGRERRERGRELAPFFRRQGVGRRRGPPGFLEHLEDRRGGFLDPRLERRRRVEPVTAEGVGPLCAGGGASSVMAGAVHRETNTSKPAMNGKGRAHGPFSLIWRSLLRRPADR